ncbi:hypothetical protein ID866_10134 [Astraeus odoratus]|nr:hypothetical protein ID866_10134 [Astraeus odoratus]
MRPRVDPTIDPDGTTIATDSDPDSPDSPDKSSSDLAVLPER